MMTIKVKKLGRFQATAHVCCELCGHRFRPVVFSTHPQALRHAGSENLLRRITRHECEHVG